MGFCLVIAEKPSVAQSIAIVIGANCRKDGFYEGNGYRVSWCLGHLAGLANAESYDPRYAKWCKEDLPIVPEHWQFEIRKEKRKQFELLRKLMSAADVSDVVNACDAGREGEAIFRMVYDLAGCRKPMLRLWISSMEEEAIRKGFEQLRPGSDYDGLYRAALCRNQADWLVGINATRLFSTLYGRTLNIGRVMSPTLALLVQREAEISAFQPEPFYNVVLALPDFSASSERISDKAKAMEVQTACAEQIATVERVEQKERQENPPALYDLTTLQRDANRLLGYTAQQTLDYAQSLYEKKLCTYPRTDSRYLTADMAQEVPVLVNLAAKFQPCAKGIPVRMEENRVINDQRVTDHHAILPTRKILALDVATLTVGERSVLELLCRRLLCAVAPPYEYLETTVTLTCAGTGFTTKGRAVRDAGWRIYDDDKSDAEKNLPLITEGQVFEVMVPGLKTGTTTPPKHYTEDSLLAAMETAGAKDMPEDAQRKGLGTPATRAGILEKLVSAGLVERKKVQKSTQLIPTPVAEALITILPEQLQSPLLTADWEYRLKEIQQGNLTAEQFTGEICTMLRELVESYQVIPGADVLFSSQLESVGTCPRCGGQVTERSKGFSCQNRACKFAIWKSNRFFEVKRKSVSKALVQSLLKDGRANLKGCYSEKTGKLYDAVIILEDDGQDTKFRLEFPARKGGAK